MTYAIIFHYNSISTINIDDSVESRMKDYTAFILGLIWKL